MSGEINFESNPGKSTKFWFNLNFEPYQALPQIENIAIDDESQDAVSITNTGHILIVEDYPLNQQVVKLHLENAGSTVHIANNGKEAVEACSENKFDIILMDIQMPVMDGLEATKILRAQDSYYAKAPIIAITAHADEGTRKNCYDVGMNEILIKPIRKAKLIKTVSQWLSSLNSDTDCEHDDKIKINTVNKNSIKS